MPLCRRPRPSRAWQVEQLEDRALLTTVYGPEPASLNVAPTQATPAVWWTSEFGKVAIDDQRRFAISIAERPTDLAVSLRMKAKQNAWSAPPSSPGTFSFESLPSGIGIGLRSSDTTYSLTPGPKLVRFLDGPEGPPPPMAITAIRAFAGGVYPGRGPLIFGRFRDDMEGVAPRFGSRPMLLVISPESYWENGIISKPDESFSFVASGTSSEARTASTSSTHSESTTSETSVYGQPPALSTLTGHSTSPSSGNVMIWVDSDTWSSDTSLSSILLSQGEFEPGALFPQDDLPELTAILASLLNEWLDDRDEIWLPLPNPVQQITTLDPLDESSLALTATLLTVSGVPQPNTAGPSPTENAPTEASLPNPNPPSWAGFVIGLDEAFEANRRATRRWPSASELQDEAGPRDEASEAARTVEQSAADEAIQSLDQDPPPQDAVDALFFPLRQNEEDELNLPSKERRLGAAARASLSLALVPALWAERLSRRREPPDQEATDEA